LRHSRQRVAFALAAFAGWLAPGSALSHNARAVRITLGAAVVEVAAGRETTPLISRPASGGEVTVTFLAQRRGRQVPRIVSDVTGWGEHTDGTFDFNAGRMTRVGRTDWYSLQAKVAPRARIEYLVAYGATDYRLDPHNPRRVAGPQFGGVSASEFVTPGYVPPPEFTDRPISPAGLITDATVESRVLGGPCPLIVYTPSAYREDGNYPVAVFLDSRAGQVSRVLDWVIAHEAIEPIVAVFVVPQPRDPEAGATPPVSAFVTDELLPWLASRYAVTRSAEKRAILGISYEAKDALDRRRHRFDRRVRPPGPADPRPEDRPCRHRCPCPSSSPSRASGHPGGPVRPGEPRDGTRAATGACRCR